MRPIVWTPRAATGPKWRLRPPPVAAAAATAVRRDAVRRDTRGFTLMELILALPLLAVVAYIALPLVRWSATSAVAAHAAAATGGRADAAVAALRRDVWGASAAAVPSPHDLSLTTADGHPVTWHVGAGAVVRHDGADRQRWADVFPDATLATDGAAVRLTVIGWQGPVVLPRAVALLGGGTR